MTKRLNLTSETLLVCKPGPKQDRKARLAVCQQMAESGHEPEAIYAVLEALALLPGTEHERDLADRPLISQPKESKWTPARRDQSSYVPN